MNLFEKFNEKCEDGMDWVADHIAAVVVIMMMLLVGSLVLALFYGDGRTCLRREPSTYIMQNNIMTPIPGACIEYETESNR